MQWQVALSEAKLTVKQFFCEHSEIEGRRWVEYDTNGAPAIIGKGWCCNCGKVMPPPPIDSRILLRMLIEAGGNQPPRV